MSPRPPEQRVDPLLVDAEGHAECLLGNEAIVRGALEAGVGFASGYPGTPSSEVTDSFARIAPARGIRFEYSVNEKIALEMAFGASLAGARAICAMKHLGLMYAGDPLSTIPYVGVVGGLVIVSAGDPSCHTSPNEQDQRHLGPMLHLPMLDPATPQEAYEMARFAFELSEKSNLPIVLRTTARVCHTRAVVRYGRLAEPKTAGFVRDPSRFVPMPQNARALRKTIGARVETARALMSASPFIRTDGNGPLGIIATGAPAATTADLICDNGFSDRFTVMTVGAAFPLPEDRIAEFVQKFPHVLVVEELSPYLEDSLHAICSRRGLKTEINGKRTGHLPVEFEYEPEVILKGIRRFLGNEAVPAPARKPPALPPRPPSLCPGCPHRAAYVAARAAFDEHQLYFNDIGCYTLGYGPPLETVDALLCMGAAFTLAAGASRVTGARTVGFLGDSTFFHSGMPALLNAIKEDANMVAVILDNQVTAMTGFQPSPGVEAGGAAPSRNVSIEAVVRALGARHVETVDPHDLPATIAAFRRAREATGTSVIITGRPCPVFLSKVIGRPPGIAAYEIDDTVCRTCGRETAGMRCDLCVSVPHERSMVYCRATGALAQENRPAVAPCATRCPLSLCVQGYAGHIRAGQYAEAFRLIMDRCPLPETVCRVCHRPCETVCVLRDMSEEPVGINDLKRFVVDWAARSGAPYEPKRDPENGLKVAVVGSGPSGLAAAHDLALRGYRVAMFDAAESPGGLLRSGIPPYRLPREALGRDIQRILGLGVSFAAGKALGHNLAIKDLLSGGFDAVYLGIGAMKGIGLGFQSERASGRPDVVDALAFLHDANTGQKAPPGRRVAVVGGGNAAIDAARTARRLGAQSVKIVYRRRREEMPAISEEIEAAEAEGIEILTQMQPARIAAGDETGLLCVRTEPGEPDASGRRRPVAVPGSERLIAADLIITAIGQAMDPAWRAPGDIELETTSDGLIKTDAETCRTSHPRVFAGGDATAADRTVTGAIAAGQRAAWAIDCALRGGAAASVRLAPPRPNTQPPDSLSLQSLQSSQSLRSPRQRQPETPATVRTTDFVEVLQPLTEARARTEASRCLLCGLCGNCRSCIDVLGCPAFYVEDDRVRIDHTLCNGCGVCAALCPNGAIRKVAPA
ncbi:MAG: FAD-dependent oxidoreductase [Deltaproteobacteria bacterium]|nr:FAD-dependent oxidoreductase [Deltaproteobacteria bacterium]